MDDDMDREDDEDADSEDLYDEDDFDEFAAGNNDHRSDSQQFIVNIPFINIINSNYQQLKRLNVFLLEQI